MQKMDPKTRLWRKRILEMSYAANNEAEISLKGNEEEKLPYEKEAALGRPVKNLHEKIASLANDKLVAKHANTTQESNTGREKTEANKSLVHLNAALKDCMQQLSSLKLEQDQRVKLERAYKKLELKYTEARKKLVNLTVENARLTKSLVTKNEIIEDVSNLMNKAKYEHRAREREVKKINRNADVDNTQRQESAKRVAKLEAERQRLRLLGRKRIPGHAKAADRRMSLKIKRLCEVEEENKILKETACRKENEIHFLKTELEAKLLESENNVVALKTELERVKKYFKDMNLINVDLDHQLSVAKVQITEALHKVSFLEMELEERSYQCEELEATCLELQFELASFPSKDVVNEYVEQDETFLQTGPEIMAEVTDNKNSRRHISLRDHMAMEDNVDTTWI